MQRSIRLSPHHAAAALAAVRLERISSATPFIGRRAQAQICWRQSTRVEIYVTNVHSSFSTAAAVRRPSLLVSAVLLAAVVIAHVVAGVQALDKPGLYMDAVNPDYLVVRMFNGHSPTEYWLAPGNLIADRFPVLAGPYSGSYVAYMLLPFYALFGGTLVALRLAHIALGLAVVVAAFIFLRETTRSLTITTTVVAVLAVDPAFVLLFRTQAYLVTFPVCIATAGFYVLYRYQSVGSRIVAGALLGLSAFGYFVFIFLVPGAVIFALFDAEARRRRSTAVGLCVGLILGLSPYLLGYGLIFVALGWGPAIGYISSILFMVHVDSGQSYLARISSVLNWSWLMITGDWDAITFWGRSTSDVVQNITAIGLLLLPAAALPFALDREHGRAFRLTGLTAASFVLVATVFGQRLGGHDLTPLLPLLFLVAGTSIRLLTLESALPERTLRSAAVVGVIGALFFGLNVAATSAMTGRLGRESGDGLFSSILSDYPRTALAHNDRTPHIFWQWGSMMQFIYLTEGRIPAYSISGMRTALCGYGRANLVLTGAESLSHPDVHFAELGAKVVAVDSLRDAHSGFPYAIVHLVPLREACRPPDSVPALRVPAGQQLPDGITQDGTTPYTGIYPAPIGKCCFLAGDAKFTARIPAPSRRLAFDVYTPGFAQVRDQRLTFFVDGARVATTGILPKGRRTTVDVPLPSAALGKRAIQIEIRPSTSFVPNQTGVNGDPHRLSVILSSVVPLRANGIPTELPTEYDYTVGARAAVIPAGLYVDADPGCCFAGPAVRMQLRVPARARSLDILLYQPPLPAHLGHFGSLRVTFGSSQPATVKRLDPGVLQTISVELPIVTNRERDLTVDLDFAKSFVPKAERMNGDTRRLSAVIRRVSFRF